MYILKLNFTFVQQTARQSLFNGFDLRPDIILRVNKTQSENVGIQYSIHTVKTDHEEIVPSPLQYQYFIYFILFKPHELH